jgi:pimeloyl-ACP methyl ester carboxylesterase
MAELAGLLTLLLAGLVVAAAVPVLVVVHEALHPPRHTAGWAVARRLPVDPGEVGLEFESWTLDLPDGVSLAVWEARGAAPAGDAAASELGAVFVHDWGESRIESLSRSAPWRRQARRVVFYDLRGHGESGGRTRLGEREERDLLALLERLGEGPFVLVATGMGAAIAAAAATAAAGDTRCPGGIRGVIAQGPPWNVRALLRQRLHGMGMAAGPVSAAAWALLRASGVRSAPDPCEARPSVPPPRPRGRLNGHDR